MRKQPRDRRAESAIVERVVTFLRCQNYRVRCEVPNMGQSIDVVATKGRWTMAVEVKTSKWQRALDQCRAHELVADFISVAICMRKVPALLVEEASRKGYGILYCDPETFRCSWMLPPCLNRDVWKPQRRVWAVKMRAIGYEY